MYSNSHITMGTSSDDLFDKSGKNQNSLHYKYNKFLTSPYLERKYNNYYANPIFENQKNDEGNKNYIDLDDNYDSFGETNIYYPKPNYYNNIYTQRFSKKYKRFYNYNNLTSNYMGNNTDNGPLDYYNNQNRNINSRNNRFKKEPNINKLKTPEYQIKKEIEIQKTPLKYDNYRRYDDYYFNTMNKERQNYNPSVISNIAKNNLFNKEYNNNNKFSSPYIQGQTRKIYL